MSVTNSPFTKFQSTPPRGGRRHPPHRGLCPCTISIHAPARGATIFTAAASPASRDFNPRPREGGDCKTCGADIAKSAFQSTPPRGGRPSSALRLPKIPSFQSTPPRGGRRPKGRAQGGHRHFNPRPREGGDHFHAGQVARHTGISIHAPARGATGTFSVPGQAASISIHAPARGATTSPCCVSSSSK